MDTTTLTLILIFGMWGSLIVLCLGFAMCCIRIRIDRITPREMEDPRVVSDDPNKVAHVVSEDPV